MEEVIKIIEENNIEFVNVEIVDVHGIPRGVKAHADYFISSWKSGLPFGVGILFFEANGNVELPLTLNRNYYANAFMYPDPHTFVQLPWKKNTASVYTDFKPNCNDVNGTDLAISTRAICKTQLSRLESMGYQLLSSFEYEFTVVKKDSTEGVHQTGNYATFTLMNKYSELTSDIMRNMKSVGMRPEVFHTESDPFQLEITHSPAFGIKGPDNAMRFKKVAKETCESHELCALFLTRPFPTPSIGNGGHFNMSVWDKEGKSNVFYDANMENKMSKLALNWMGGLQEHWFALTCIARQTYNCYSEVHQPTPLSPFYNLWGFENRSVAFRMKTFSEKSTYIENRLSRSSVNPYLMTAACIIAGIDGIERNLQPKEPFSGDAFIEKVPNDVEKIPKTLDEALEGLNNDQLFMEQLGAEFIKAFTKVKKDEIRDAEKNKDNSSWCLEYYGEFI